MLRDNFYRNYEVTDVLNQFVGVEGISYAVIKMSRMLTPDSFIWKIEIGKERYYLYAEEYSQSLTTVRHAVEEVAGQGSGEFLKVREAKELEDTPMYKSPRTHVPIDTFESIQPYVTSSGFDLVYLYHVTSRPTRTAAARTVRVRGSVSG